MALEKRYSMVFLYIINSMESKYRIIGYYRYYWYSIYIFQYYLRTYASNGLTKDWMLKANHVPLCSTHWIPSTDPGLNQASQFGRNFQDIPTRWCLPSYLCCFINHRSIIRDIYHKHPYSSHSEIGVFGRFIELDDGKIYRKRLFVGKKPWFPVDFP